MASVRRLLLLAVPALAVVAAVPLASAAPPSCTPEAGWGTNRPDLAKQVLELVNSHRAGMGLSQLAASPTLTASAEWKSLHMARYAYFAHDDPAPASRSAFQRTQECGYRGSTWGENIAWGYPTPQSAVAGWLGSPGHRAAIENPAFSTAGVGVGSGGGRLYWTIGFGNDLSAASRPPAAAAPRKTGIGGRAPQVSRAGSRLVARVVFVDLGTGRLVTQGQVRCRAYLGAVRLRVVANVLHAGAARCAWRVPSGAAGRRFVGVVGLRVGGVSASRPFVRDAR
jgi:uncharacterized protein YkwD